jgi:ABC-type transporter Mla subunit MlaD
MNKGADAIQGASEGFRAASQSLTAAADPIRASHERIETTLRRVGDLVETVSETLMQNSASVAENAAHVLDTAQTALGTEREGIRRNLEATRAAIAQLSDEAEKLDKIDAMLGRALTQYNAQLEAALGSAQDHVSQMRDALAPGLDTLKSVVEQAEAFLPRQPRGRA